MAAIIKILKYILGLIVAFAVVIASVLGVMYITTGGLFVSEFRDKFTNDLGHLTYQQEKQSVFTLDMNRSERIKELGIETGPSTVLTKFRRTNESSEVIQDVGRVVKDARNGFGDFERMYFSMVDNGIETLNKHTVRRAVEDEYKRMQDVVKDLQALSHLDSFQLHETELINNTTYYYQQHADALEKILERSIIDEAYQEQMYQAYITGLQTTK